MNLDHDELLRLKVELLDAYLKEVGSRDVKLLMCVSIEHVSPQKDLLAELVRKHSLEFTDRVVVLTLHALLILV